MQLSILVMVCRTKGPDSATSLFSVASPQSRNPTQTSNFRRCNDELPLPLSSQSVAESRAWAANDGRLNASSRWSANYRRRWRVSRLTPWTAKSNPGWARSAGLWTSTGVPYTSAIRPTDRYVRRIPGFDRISHLSRGAMIQRSSCRKAPSWSWQGICLLSRVPAIFRSKTRI